MSQSFISLVGVSVACFGVGFFTSLLIVAPCVGVFVLKSVAGVAADIRGS